MATWPGRRTSSRPGFTPLLLRACVRAACVLVLLTRSRKFWGRGPRQVENPPQQRRLSDGYMAAAFIPT